MGRAKQPIAVIQARGNKHLGKNEIAERMAKEIKPVTDGIVAPAYLSKKQKDEFYKISDQLGKLKIMGETDTDALARYIIAQDFYINAVKQLRKKEVREDVFIFEKWSNLQDKYFKQARASAGDLGLTISSRCKLVVPEPAEVPTENKFKKFEKRSAVGG